MVDRSLNYRLWKIVELKPQLSSIVESCPDPFSNCWTHLVTCCQHLALLPIIFKSCWTGKSVFVNHNITCKINVFLNVQAIIFSPFSYLIERLLVEFFDFYLEFNFVQNIVSPYFGRPLPVKELKESQDERIRSFQVIRCEFLVFCCT